MTKRKKHEGAEKLSPLDEEMGEAAPSPAPTSASASDAELQSASIFTETGTAPLAGAADSETKAVETPLEAAELGEWRAKADEYLDGWQRARAEFANYKKRIEREQEEARGRAAAALLTKILPIEDDLRRAVRERPATDGLPTWADGIELIERKLAAVLDAEGVEVIAAEGAVFDPALHEAVTYEPSDDHHEGQIIEVIQQGYRLGERVLRPARVRVAR